MDKEKLNLLLCLTGSVATVRIDSLVEAFKHDFNLKLILTKNAKIFSHKIIQSYKDYEIKNNIQIYFDEDEYDTYKSNDTVLHIDLRKWADAVLIAPLSANTMAKITNGLCDNLLTSVIRAWDFNKPGFFACAMNTFMYEHFLTEKQIKILTEDFKFIEIPPVIKKLKCGDFGIGGIADTSTIFSMVSTYFKNKNKE